MKTPRMKIPIEWSAPRPARAGDEASPSPDQFECEIKVLPTFPNGPRAQVVRILKLGSGGRETTDVRMWRGGNPSASTLKIALLSPKLNARIVSDAL